ncbi:hypothetical protein BDD12DRAFT_916387 [Trichophaea hybrida]|nr:hypothetical protein BDD12DRAFT_916387 [Trichophaea hybrida]
MEKYWLSKCTPQRMPMPPLERYIYVLPENVVKKRLQEHEKGYRGYLPDFTTLKKRDDNELLALELIREHLPNLSVRVPGLVYKGEDFNVFTRIPGICVDRTEVWEKITQRQREGLLYQTRDIIKQLSLIPNPNPGRVHSPHPSGILFRPKQLQHVGPFPSTTSFLEYNKHLEGLIDPSSQPVFSHLDWDLSNLILAPNGDAVVGVVDWERAAWFPEAGKVMHGLVYQWDGWEGLFDDSE